MKLAGPVFCFQQGQAGSNYCFPNGFQKSDDNMGSFIILCHWEPLFSVCTVVDTCTHSNVY